MVSAIKSRIFRCLRHMNNNDFYTKMLTPIIHTSTDLQIEVVPVPFRELAEKKPGEPSAVIRQRVIAARAIQEERFRGHPGIHCNAQMGTKLFQKYCVLDAPCQELMKTAMERLGLSARAYDRILKVARTIADLEAAPNITTTHLSEAITYRSLDRDSWGQ